LKCNLKQLFFRRTLAKQKKNVGAVANIAKTIFQVWAPLRGRVTQRFDGIFHWIASGTLNKISIDALRLPTPKAVSN
jgi:hypothetical protein